LNLSGFFGNRSNRSGKPLPEAGCFTLTVSKKTLEPAAWAITSKAAQVDTEDLIDHLRLAVGLRREHRAEAQLHAREGKELLPKVAGEDRILIADNGATVSAL
jgi:hypothetical protein